MSKAGSTTNLPPIAHEPLTSEPVASLRGERRLSDEKVLQTGTENISDDANVLRVNWDGPGDPMNPKK